mmetsp:Transcript_55073/g.164966  ORF Transcript_55073/g.164966 Transcript_55073/m.164966 type:complete len:233 (-) Transcript_55073:1063-1761(-)
MCSPLNPTFSRSHETLLSMGRTLAANRSLVETETLPPPPPSWMLRVSNSTSPAGTKSTDPPRHSGGGDDSSSPTSPSHVTLRTSAGDEENKSPPLSSPTPPPNANRSTSPRTSIGSSAKPDIHPPPPAAAVAVARPTAHSSRQRRRVYLHSSAGRTRTTSVEEAVSPPIHFLTLSFRTRRAARSAEGTIRPDMRSTMRVPGCIWTHWCLRSEARKARRHLPPPAAEETKTQN